MPINFKNIIPNVFKFYYYHLFVVFCNKKIMSIPKFLQFWRTKWGNLEEESRVLGYEGRETNLIRGGSDAYRRWSRRSNGGDRMQPELLPRGGIWDKISNQWGERSEMPMSGEPIMADWWRGMAAGRWGYLRHTSTILLYSRATLGFKSPTSCLRFVGLGVLSFEMLRVLECVNKAVVRVTVTSGIRNINQESTKM